MWLRRKRGPNTTEAEPTDPPWRDKMAGSVARVGIKLQKAFAAHMDRWTGKLSPKSLKAVLAIFCLLCGGLSGYWIISAALNWDKKAMLPTPQAVQTPKHVVKSREPEHRWDRAAETRKLRRMYFFRRYRDSLQRVRGGGYDSLLMRSPALRDSISKAAEMDGAQPLK